MIATGSAYAQEPVVIIVGEQKPDTLTSDSIFQKAYHSRIFLTGGSDIGYASYVHEIDMVEISRRFVEVEVGIAIFKNENLGASHILKFGFAPFSNYISRHEYRLSTVFKLCSNSLLRRKGK